ncbi:MAG: LapA family protein [Parvibaculum sp.]|nr:LapA family protein [Parvibaculum sp.]|tara:strand:+ start:1734 stop:2024 length:291 start_codon:yes stop_codon:yes gene_type:complete
MKFLRWLLLVPVALLAIVIAIANRQPVTFSLDPFDPLNPAIGLTMPLALIVILAMFAGILIGGAASWRQARVKTAKRSSPIMPAAAPAASLPATQD